MPLQVVKAQRVTVSPSGKIRRAKNPRRKKNIIDPLTGAYYANQLIEDDEKRRQRAKKRKAKAHPKKKAAKKGKAKKNAKKKSRFEKLEKSIAARGGAYDPRAVAAAIGRRKYGKKKFQKMALVGKKRAAKKRKVAR